jgi:hypothetical protein
MVSGVFGYLANKNVLITSIVSVSSQHHHEVTVRTDRARFVFSRLRLFATGFFLGSTRAPVPIFNPVCSILWYKIGWLKQHLPPCFEAMLR